MLPPDQLRAAGVPCFPCWTRYDEQKNRWNKGPAIPRGVSWQDAANWPADQLDWSSGVIGVPIPAGVVVLDLDTYKGVTREQVEAFLGVALPWDAALIQRTIGGGEHYAFRCAWPVRQGDSLTAISYRSYGDTMQYMVIYDANRDKISAPDRIRVGQELTIPVL